MATTQAPSTSSCWLEGVWQGRGTVVHKNMAYNERSEFKVLRTSPCTIVNVQQFTKHAETQAPLHAENGFFKIFPANADTGAARVEASYSHPFGMNEFEFGELTPNKLTLVASEEHHF